MSREVLSVLLRIPQKTTVVLALFLADKKRGKWLNGFCALKAYASLKKGFYGNLILVNGWERGGG